VKSILAAYKKSLVKVIETKIGIPAFCFGKLSPNRQLCYFIECIASNLRTSWSLELQQYTLDTEPRTVSTLYICTRHFLPLVSLT